MPQLEYNVQAEVAREGMAYDSTGTVVSATNKNPQAKQIDTITIDTATDTEDYSYTVDGIEVKVTAASAVAADIAQLLVEKHFATALVSGRVAAARNGDDVVLTSRVGGLPDFDIVLVDNVAKMTLVATQATATADEVDFGRLVIMDGQNDSSGAEILGKLAKATSMTARAVTLTPTATNLGEYVVTVEIDGARFLATFTADGSATAAEIVNAILASLNDQLPAESVLAANVADALVLTAELAGKDFIFGTGYDVAASAWAVTADNALTADTDINTLSLGVSMLDHSNEKPRPTVPGQIGGSQFNAKYAANKPMSINEDGRTYVVPEGTVVARRTPVFVRLVADGALDKLGGFAAAAGTGLALLRNAKWHKVDGSFAVVQTLR